MKPAISVAIALVLVFAVMAVRGRAAEPVSGPGSAAMIAFLQQEARRLDARYLEGLQQRSDWEARRAEFHREYLETLGLWPLPERTPLAAQVTGTLVREEGFRVETLHFQSRPRLYVTANLYLPKEARAGDRLPAVLYVCGHSGRGRDGNKTAFQHHGMWFATHGYACLVIDTLQLGEIEAIHHGTYRHGRWWWHSRGYSPAAVECWNGIRALDYLQSRPEVDPERLAVTGISGGGAATFWIAAADERVKVAVPVSGMSDLEDYVGNRIVNGHCDCMFCPNPFRWAWTDLAALVAPRPMLFANSGHDTIFPMDGNDRIRARLERLYGWYTNRTDRLFDIGVVPGGHEDKPELRLMAYRWINRHLQGNDSPVTEPVLPPFEGAQLRAFPGELPADQINTRIDELWIPVATPQLPQSRDALGPWREAKMAALNRLVFAGSLQAAPAQEPIELPGNRPARGTVPGESGIGVPWQFLPGDGPSGPRDLWLVVLGEDEALDSRPAWLEPMASGSDVLLVAPRGSGPLRWSDPAPYYIQRSLPLLGRTVDSCRLADVLAVVSAVSAPPARGGSPRTLRIAGRGTAGVLGAYAALPNPQIVEVALVDPPESHRAGPQFLNVLRVLDIPEALGMLAPRKLTLRGTADLPATRELYRVAGVPEALRWDP